MTPVSLLTCVVLVGGEHGGAAAVFPHDGGVSAGMVWREPTPRPKQTLTRLKKEERRREWSSGEVRRNRCRDGREPDDDELAKCRSAREDLVQPRGGGHGGAQGRIGDAQRRGEMQRRGREELAKLTAAMATAFSPSGARERDRERMDGR